MKAIILNLNPETRKELYEDISEDLLAFIIMEALFNVVKDIPNTMSMYMQAVDDPETYAEDPDSNLMSSIEFLMEVMKEHDAKSGVDVDSQLYLDGLADTQSFISTKLCNAVEAISQFNDLVVFSAAAETLCLPEFSTNLNFSTTHLGDKVMFLLNPSYAFS